MSQGVTLSTTLNMLESTSPNESLWIQNLEAKKWSDVDVNGVSGGVYVYDPVIISLPNGKVHAFSVGTNLKLHHKWYSKSTGWSSWVSTGNNCISSPVVTHYGTATANTFTVFIVGTDHIPRGGISTSDTDFLWTAIGDGVKQIRSDSLAAVERSYDQAMSVVGVELTTGELLHTWNNGVTWSSVWDTLRGAGYCISKPTIQSTYRGSPGGNGWGAWQNLSGTYVYDPASISVSTGRIDVFGIGSDGQVYRNTATITGNETGVFTQTCMGAPSISSATAKVTSPGVFSVTTKKSKGVYQQAFYESATGVWTPQGGMTEIVPPA